MPASSPVPQPTTRMRLGFSPRRGFNTAIRALTRYEGTSRSMRARLQRLCGEVSARTAAGFKPRPFPLHFCASAPTAEGLMPSITRRSALLGTIAAAACARGAVYSQAAEQGLQELASAKGLDYGSMVTWKSWDGDDAINR